MSIPGTNFNIIDDSGKKEPKKKKTITIVRSDSSYERHLKYKKEMEEKDKNDDTV